MNSALLTLDIRTDWHPGTGRGSGFHLDALTHTGADGLPRLPGRTLKGLLRDALWRAESWCWPDVPAGSTAVIFGTAAIDQASSPGLLRVSDATLPAAVSAWLAGTPEGRALIPGLYREHFSTAIDHQTGVALGRSLRGMRTIVPLTLQARLEEVAGVPTVPDWHARLSAVLPLVTAVGASRSRGFGRVCLSWATENSR